MLISGIKLAISESILKFLLWIDSILYETFGKLFLAYFELANFQLFKSASIDNVIKNLYLVVGVVALFMLVFILLQSMVDPNGDKGSKQIFDIIKRFIFLSTLTCLIPTFFDFLTDAQNSLMTWNVVPRVLLSGDKETIEANVLDENGNQISTETVTMSEATAAVFQYRVNGMVITILDGLMYPIKNGQKVDDLTISISDWYEANPEAPLLAPIIGCAAGAIAGGIIGAVSFGSLTIPAGAVVVALCGGGMLGGSLGVEGMKNISANNYTWSYSKYTMVATGSYRPITLFSEAIAKEQMHYTPIITTVIMGFLIYMIISFCIDLAVRSAKLWFYQIMAPICFLVGVIPQKKDLVSNWFKVVITTWLEVFVRIGCVCGIVLLVGQLNLNELSSTFKSTPIISSFAVLGIVIFAKQIPKLLKDVTGLDSGDMKLGIKDKLAAGGAFAAGAAIGGGVTALTRNGVAGIRNVAGNFERGADNKLHLKKGKTGWDVAGSGISALASTAAGGMSGFARSAKSGWGAKSAADMKKSASSGASDAVSARDKRAAYKASHGDRIFGFERDSNGKLHATGAIAGHVSDAWIGVKDWAGYDNLATLKQQKSNYDQITGYMSQLKKFAEGEAAVQAYAGQLKALSETEINRNDYMELDATGETVFNSEKYAKALSDHKDAYEAAERRYKLAIAQAIVDNAPKKGNYKEVIQKYNTFRAQNMSDPAIANLGDMNITNIVSQWSNSNGNKILSSGSDAEVKDLWDKMKSQEGVFNWAYNDNQSKIASGDIAQKIAEKEAEERKKNS